MNEGDNPWKDAEVISTYSRAQAIEDGVLIELDVTAKEAGFKWSVAMTAAVFAIVNPSEALKREGQSFAGRAWDMLTILKLEIRRSKSQEVIEFSPLFILAPGETPKPVKLKSVAGPGDGGEGVITIMLPSED